MAEERMKEIEFKNVSFSYKSERDDTGEPYENKVLENFDLGIEKGSFTAIIGRNGSGKSTAARLINAILVPDSGSVFTCGMDTREKRNIPMIRRKAGMVFQNPDNQTVCAIVEDDVAFAPENLGIEPQEIRRRVNEALDATGMREYAESEVACLSGGQKQRAAIAGVLATKPEVLILDEPTSMLDPKGRADVMKIIKKLNREKGMTIVLITHDMDAAAEADRIVIPDGGKIALSGTPEEVFEDEAYLMSLGLGVPVMLSLLHALKARGADIPARASDIEGCFAETEELLREKRID